MERQTTQRRAIREVFAEAGRPLGPQEALEAAQSRVPKLGIATVYRTIKGLIEDGFLAPVELPGEPARYELAHQAHHHHFQCRGCSKVFDISGCSASISAAAPTGFVVDSHEVVLYGRCPDCVTPGQRSNRARRHDHSHHAH